jgi:TatD DNase family protein
MLIDTHAHISGPEYFDCAEVLARAKQRGVLYIIDIGCEPGLIEKSLALSEQTAEIYSAIGIHPHDAALLTDAVWQNLRRHFAAAAKEKIVGVGETGLDFFKNYAPRDLQLEAFIRQIKLAKEFDLPLVVHARSSEDEALKILRQEGFPKRTGVFHCYAGSIEQAQKILDLGFYISVTGIVTYPKADNIRQVVKNIPLDKLLLETDCPYLSPQNLRGKRNEPANVSLVAEKISEVLGLPTQVVAETTTANARRLFRLP